MSSKIDEKVVEMRFDNKQFEKNVQTSLSTIDKLKQSLNLTGASKGLENVSEAAKRFNITPISNAVETVRMKFSALEVMAITALSNITNSAINVGKRIVSSLTIDPIKTGFQEYETQINAVQTILANTESKGSTLEDVNAALDELNTYADKTIYNFTEMTRNIGTFTAAGVDLDTSVAAIKGISNLAAVSGSSAQQASTAMYQLSQALASGRVNLQDWNSVVNAGMGGQVFQDALKETARVHGIAIDQMIKDEGSFRETLKNGWLTSDVLTETLAKFTGDLNEEQLKTMGYSEKQIESIMKMGQTANDAATKVKTFTQLFDTLKEAAQSGWTQSWEIIVGDFEEAKALLTEVSDTFGGIINASAQARNEMLEGWKDLGGRSALIESVKNAFEGVASIVTPVKEAFRDIFPAMTGKQLFDLTEKLKNLTEKFKIGETTANNLKRTFKGVFALFDIGAQGVKALVSGFSKLLSPLASAGDGVLGFTANIGDFLVSINESITSSNVFGKAVEKIGDFIKKIADTVKLFGKSISDSFSEIAEKTEIRIEPLKFLSEGVKALLDGIVKAFSKTIPFVSNMINGLINVFGSIKDRIGNSIQSADYDSIFDIISGGVLTAIGIQISKFIKSANGILNNAGGFVENLKNILGSVSEAFNAFTESLKAQTLLKIAGAIGILAASLLVISLIDSEKLASSLAAISVLFVELSASMAFFGKIADGKGFDNIGKVSRSMISMSAALLILSAAMKVMSSLSWDEIGRGLTATASGLAILVVAVNLLPKKNVEKASSAIKKLATALLIFSAAMKIMGSLSWNEMEIGLVATTAGLAALVASVNLLPKNMAMKSAGMVAMATSLTILGGALKIMGSLSWDQLKVGLAAVAGALAAIVIAMKLMPKSIIVTSSGLVAVATAMVILGGALKIMSSMSWDETAKGLVSLGGSLLIIATSMKLMRGALPGAAALLVVAAALTVLTPVLKILGGMSWGEISKGMVALAGAFAVIGVAGLVLKPLIPTLLALSAAIVLFGVGCAAVGAGILAFSAGVASLAVSGAAGAAAIVTIVTSIIGLIPYLIEQIGVGIIKLCEVIAGGASAICEAVTVIITSVVEALVASVPVVVDGVFVLVDHLLLALVEHTPVIVKALFDFLIGLLNAVAEKLPELIQAGVNVVMAFFAGIIDALKSIDPNVLVKGIAAVGIMSAIMLALAAMAALTPAAMVGVLGMAAVVAELSLVLAAIGALAQIPGLEWIISEGGSFLQTIGNAIGKFLGGIVGGFAQGVSSALPQIGNDLSAFMTNIQPFVEGARRIDSASFEGVKALAGIILTLTAANILDGLTSWFTGGSSLTKFGEELATFGPHMKQYSDAVKGIDGSAVEASAIAAKSLSELASNLPNSGGLVGWFAGENDIGQFGEQLIPFGKGMKAYSLSVSGIDSEAITNSAAAAKALAEMTSCIPNQGGMVAWFAGDNSVAQFGSDLIALGIGLKGYSQAISDFDSDAVVASANAAKALSDMTNSIPNSGGVVSWFAGDNSIAKFSSELITLGSGLKGFSLSIKGMSAENVTAAANAAKSLADMTNAIPNSGGVVSWFSGDNSISKFASELPNLGNGLKGFSDSLKGLVPENVIAASNAAKTLADMTNSIPNEGGVAAWFTGSSSISKFGNDLVSLGEGIKGFSDSVEGISIKDMQAASDAAKSLAEMTSYLPDEGGIDSWFVGEKSISKFGSDLVSLGRGLKGFSSAIIGIKPENITSAANAAKALAEMTAIVPTEGGMKAWFTGENSMSKFSSELPALGEGLKGFSDSVVGIGTKNVTTAADAAKTLGEMASTIPGNADNLVWFGENLKIFGSSLLGYFSITDDITTQSTSSSTRAINAVKAATKIDSEKLKNIADAIDRTTNSLKNMAGIDGEVATKFASALTELGNTSSRAFLSSFDGIDDEMKNTAQSGIDVFINGVTQRKPNAKKAASDLIKECASAMNSRTYEFRNAAANLVNGFANGISANTWKAEAKSRAMAAAAAKAARRELDEHSPSKVGYEIGDYFGMPFVGAIAKYIPKAYAAGSNLADSAKGGLRKSIRKIRDLINSDIDMQPTIRPVLDLNNVRTGIENIGSMMQFGSAVDVLANVGSIGSMMNHRVQNGADSELVSAINELRSDLSKVGNTTYSINGITYDDGSNISDAVRTLVRAARVERRI